MDVQLVKEIATTGVSIDLTAQEILVLKAKWDEIMKFMSLNDGKKGMMYSDRKKHGELLTQYNNFMLQVFDDIRSPLEVEYELFTSLEDIEANALKALKQREIDEHKGPKIVGKISLD